jgi:hypothetical protein
LIAFRINYGDPKTSDGAIYDRRTVKKNKSGEEVETLFWNLSGMQDPYLICGYFATSMILTRSLAGLSKCEATSIKGPNLGEFEIKVTLCS